MKHILIAIATLVLFVGTAVADVFVRGHYRSDGTYVRPHYRSSPDSSYNNNWSVSPNVNPYTGRRGTRSPTYNDRPPSSYGGFGRGSSFGTFGGSRDNCSGLLC